MLRIIYILCLSLLFAVSVAGTAWCAWLILSGDSAGLVNLGKCLVLLLYSGYRLGSILGRRYLIYRPWESGRARAVKAAAHGLLVVGLLLSVMALVLLAGLFDVNALPWFIAAIAITFSGFAALEVTNAFNPERGAGP